ncbi:hypothetical protein J0X19_23755 [Hymenobacter sp. BT186]|uniref:Uncharacterized protein n=1 Tax=Hymenobacter telluris TaxID=2816474 RepID=A0A939F1D3_9BACT|nr:hypothetical protein [Hymenobacter telluris]MBO0360996.1 hypothetical protein [Hymenobacter telluris]MBW3377024.1 hypothetical protein [Hymenobacter norwichensis]
MKDMEAVYVDGVVTAEEIKETITGLFSSLSPFQWNLFDGDAEPEGFDSSNPKHVFFATSVSNDSTEFNLKIWFFMNQSAHADEREQLIAKTLSAKFHLRTLVPFTHPKQPLDPFYDIVFIDGISFLADDSQVEFDSEDGNKGVVKILHPYELPVLHFDGVGNLLNV